jgi:hypothetical protein
LLRPTSRRTAASPQYLQFTKGGGACNKIRETWRQADWGGGWIFSRGPTSASSARLSSPKSQYLAISPREEVKRGGKGAKSERSLQQEWNSKKSWDGHVKSDKFN